MCCGMDGGCGEHKVAPTRPQAPHHVQGGLGQASSPFGPPEQWWGPNTPAVSRCLQTGYRCCQRAAGRSPSHGRRRQRTLVRDDCSCGPERPQWMGRRRAAADWRPSLRPHTHWPERHPPPGLPQRLLMSGLSELVTPLWREKLVKDSWTDWSQATLCNSAGKEIGAG